MWFRSRFIPTCVGNTHQETGGHGLFSVHPHVRGEYMMDAQAYRNAVGSSPRAWGIHYSLFNRRNVERFIPTCVGNTAGHGLHLTLDPVHPHVRGEYGSPPKGVKVGAGSSPRAWGILEDDMGAGSV